ncbi:MAG: 4-(cytidine 5'-diphospho)-2-C-methyl-D-erythritol kinase [Alphaproteobacteria bacterium]
MEPMGGRSFAVTAGVTHALRQAAPAKINLYLHVLGRRDDGMHLLDSLVKFTSFGDEISVMPAGALTIEIDGPFADGLNPDDKNNLVRQAAENLAAATGRPAHAAIRLTKNIPIAAGLGGGSANAAATLRALMALWQIPPNSVDLPALALRLGADVPMCLHSRPAFVGGIGEHLTPAPPLPKFGLLLVNPGIPLPTPQVFQARSGSFSSSARFENGPRDAAELFALLADRYNDLTAPAAHCCAAVSQVLAALDASPGCRLARLCGSGATCFGLFDDRQTAAAAAQALQPSPWWVMATESN